MAWSNFVVTAAAVVALASLMRTDVRQSSAMLRRNLKQIRSWVDTASAQTSKSEGLSSGTLTSATQKSAKREGEEK